MMPGWFRVFFILINPFSNVLVGGKLLYFNNRLPQKSTEETIEANDFRLGWLVVKKY